MKIALGSDHAGVEAKDRLVQMLQGLGHDVDDLGTNGPDSVDYPDYALLVARKVSAGEVERGILVCGTGIGMAITANKVPGVRAAKVNDPFEAKMCRAHNDANVLCLGARVVDPTVMDEMVRVYVDEAFEGGRHATRVGKMNDAESSTAG